MTEVMPEAQKTAIAELLDDLKTNYYPNAKIVGHREIGSSDCPGKKFPLDELKNYKDILNSREDTEMTIEEKERMDAIDAVSYTHLDVYKRQQSEISIAGLDGTAQDYYVYVSGATTVSAFKMTFAH